MSSIRSRIGVSFKSICTTDLRSLALFRICLGFLTMVDLLDRIPDLKIHYSDLGVLPRYAMLDHFDDGRLLVFHLLHGSTGFAVFLFVLNFLCALALLLGYRTKLANGLTWVFALSLAGRQPEVTYAADSLMRLLLLWGIFLPLGARWSVDRALNRTEPRGSNQYYSIAVLGLLLQIASVYIFTAIAKHQEAPWRDGLGVYYAVMTESYATPIGAWISHFPLFLKWTNYGVLLFEGFAAFALFIPWQRNFLRLPLFFAFFLFHVGMGLGLYVTFFQTTALAGWTAALPTSFWILLRRRFKMTSKKCFRLFAEMTRSIQKNFARSGLHSPSDKVAWPLRRALSRTARVLAVLVIANTVLWNAHITWPKSVSIPPGFSNATYALGLDQTWGMFAKPFRRSGWFVIPAKLADGSDIDLLQNGAPLSWEKPKSISGMFRDERDRKYMLNLLGADKDPSKLGLGNYYCKSWNEEHTDPTKKLEAFKIVYRRADILLDGNLGTVESEMLWQHQCQEGLLDKWGSKIATGPSALPHP